MTTCIIRTGIIYIMLVLALRLTGKRQIGELETTELVSTVLISEIAASPVSNQDVPLTFALVPVLLIISLEVVISFLATRSNILKKIFLGSPSILIKQGKIQTSELTRARISLEELLCEIRVSGTAAIEDVDYAILESNGKLSVTTKDKSGAGIAHAIVIDGIIKKEALNGAGKDETWLFKQIKNRSIRIEDVFLFTVDDNGHIYIIKRNETT